MLDSLAVMLPLGTEADSECVEIHTRRSRQTWEAEVGPIPARLWVLHRCDNGRCVNADHLFLGTHQENMRDKAIKGRAPNNWPDHGAKTHCPQGHAYDEPNTYRYAGRRFCRACNCEKQRRYMRRLKERGL